MAARTVLQLGAELISSDAVAFYELIKNAFDAGSPKVWIRVVARLPHDRIRSGYLCMPQVPAREPSEDECEAIGRCRSSLLPHINMAAPDAEAFRKALKETATWEGLREVLDEANYIEIEDSGSGMSRADLGDVFLTIGTRNRQRNRVAGFGGGDRVGDRIELGEKGLGRLSSMRLGWRLRVRSTKTGETHWNVLEIDWRRFSHDSDELIENISLAPTTGAIKEVAGSSGTILHISGLTTAWTSDRVEELASQEFSKLTDPFTPKQRYPIVLTFNGETVAVPRFDRLLTKYAHAFGTARLTLGDGHQPRLFGKIEYKLRGRERTFAVEGADILGVTHQDSLDGVAALGPVYTEFYWFNRLLLKAVEENIEELRLVKELQRVWAGGLMVFRDGFRVHPYGEPDDDWLDLDKKALASSGYRVNRRQLVGRVTISSRSNPALLDQTNREGLRDCEEKRTLVSLLKHVLETEFRRFLKRVDDDLRAAEPAAFDALEEQVLEAEEEMQKGLQLILEKHPDVRADEKLIEQLSSAGKHLRDWMRRARELAESYDAGRAQLIHLAGVGLMVEILGHELARATTNTIATLQDASGRGLTAGIESLFSTLRSQLTTLQKRLRVLDPLSTSGRQVREWFNLPEWIQEILQAHEAQFKRHGIECVLNIEPAGAPVRVRIVKGMIVQIIENLISNSVYWLDQQRKLNPSFTPEIRVTVYADRKEVHFLDNGPGIAIERREEVFQAFVTTKPPGEGKGLGLYISRELARYNDADLFLSDRGTVHADRLDTFVLRLEGGAQ